MEPESMVVLVGRTLAITLLAGAERPVALLDDTAGAPYRPIVANDCQVHLAPSNAAYLDELQNVLAQEQPGCLLLAPPLIASEKLSKGLQKQYPHLGLHEIALQVALERMPDQGLVGVWLPGGFFVNLSSQPLREAINATATPRFIVDFAFNFTLGEAAIKMHLLVAQAGMAKDRVVRFFRCPEIPRQVNAAGRPVVDEARQQAVLRDLQRLAKQGGGATEFGYVLRQGIPANTPWLFDRHHPTYRRHVEELRYFGGIRPLGEVVDIRLGFHTSEQVNLLLPGGESNQGIPVIEGRDIGADNRLRREDTRYRALAAKAQAHQLQAGDICLRASLGPDQKLKAVLIEAEMLPLVANNTILILRPRPEVNIDVAFLTAYLQSDHVVHALRAQGIAQRLYAQSLADIPVPVQDEEVRRVLHDLRSAARTLSQWQGEAEAALRSLFDFESARDARASLLETGRRVRQRERAARQIDELSYRLRIGLPHPLAYRWRLAETAQPTLEGYRHVLEGAEIAACYLALIALVMARRVGESIGHVAEMADRLTNRRQGTNFGDWLAILRQARDNKRLRQAPNAPFYEVTRFLDNPVVDGALSRLKQNRDDEAHGRGPRGVEIPPKVKESLGHLRVVLEAVEFLTEYPLRYVEETYRDSITGITRYLYREIMGDHALVPVLETETTMAEVEAHSLYLVDRRGELHLVRPFLTRRECACGRWEIFFLDHYDGEKDTCMLKSMEKGHTIQDSHITAVLRQVSLLLHPVE
jgi:hypothetical protein